MKLLRFGFSPIEIGLAIALVGGLALTIVVAFATYSDVLEF